jgi:hypothetical protein
MEDGERRMENGNKIPKDKFFTHRVCFYNQFYYISRRSRRFSQIQIIGNYLIIICVDLRNPRELVLILNPISNVFSINHLTSDF